MNDVIMWIIIGVIAAAVLGVLIYFIVKICKMSPEERKQMIITWLKGAVAWAEEQFSGSGRGEEKLAEVEKYFKEKAPWFIKILFKVSGEKNLKDLIEKALSGVKQSFGSSSKTDDTKNGEDK